MVWCIINQYRIIYWINKCASTFSISLQFLTCIVKIYIYIAVGQQCSKYSRNYWRFGRSSGMEQTHELCVTGFSQRHSVPGGADLFFLPMWRLKELIWMLHVLFQNSTQSHSFAWSQQLYELDTEKYWQILHLQRNKSEVFVADLALTPLGFYAFLSTIHLFHIHCCQAVTMTL